MFGSRSASPEDFEGGRNTIDLDGMEELMRNRGSEMAAPVLGQSRESDGSGETGRNANGRYARAGGRGMLDGDIDPQPRVRQYRRPLPQPRPFEGRSEESLDHFFRTYERYAQSAWSDDPCDWIAGLENFLVAWPLTLYRGLITQGKSYNQIKEALVRAFPQVNDPFNTRHLLTLVNLKREPGEPLAVFFQRTENLIAQTYSSLDEASRRTMTRDTFLIKVSPGVSAKIANYCNSRDDFSYEAVRVAAAMVDTPDCFREPSETVNVAQLTRETLGAGRNDMKCYICGGSWHPVSACSLYPQVFTCPLCRLTPHPITECRLYDRFMQIRGSRGGANGMERDSYRRYDDGGRQNRWYASRNYYYNQRQDDRGVRRREWNRDRDYYHDQSRQGQRRDRDRNEPPAGERSERRGSNYQPQEANRVTLNDRGNAREDSRSINPGN